MIKLWYDYTLGAVMAKHGDDTFKMLDKEDNTERAKLLETAHQLGYKDGGNWITPYSEELWSGIKRLGNLLMILMSYDMRFQATYISYDGFVVRFKDAIEWSESLKELFRKLDEIRVPTPGTASSRAPYSKELWDALLAEGKRVDDS